MTSGINRFYKAIHDQEYNVKQKPFPKLKTRMSVTAFSFRIKSKTMLNIPDYKQSKHFYLNRRRDLQ